MNEQHDTKGSKLKFCNLLRGYLTNVTTGSPFRDPALAKLIIEITITPAVAESITKNQTTSPRAYSTQLQSQMAVLFVHRVPLLRFS